jgi:hypothetical protein
VKTRVEQNTISRSWTVVHKGKRYSVNYTESDRQTLALCNRANWEISEETEDGIEELNTCAEEEARLVDQLIAFCIDTSPDFPSSS